MYNGWGFVRVPNWNPDAFVAGQREERQREEERQTDTVIQKDSGEEERQTDKLIIQVPSLLVREKKDRERKKRDIQTQ